MENFSWVAKDLLNEFYISGMVENLSMYCKILIVHNDIVVYVCFNRYLQVCSQELDMAAFVTKMWCQVVTAVSNNVAYGTDLLGLYTAHN